MHAATFLGIFGRHVVADQSWETALYDFYQVDLDSNGKTPEISPGGFLTRRLDRSQDAAC
jgi:hypothetical protein